MKRTKKLTIRDIGEITRVSHMTVSRVVNNKKYVGKETREKVLKAIKKYGYEPDIVARSLKTRKSATIGLILGDIVNPFYSEIAEGVISISEAMNYNVILCNSRYNIKLGERYINMLLQKNIDGLLVATIYLTKKSIKKIKERGVPFVLITVKLGIPGENYVISDDYYGGEIAAKYLLEMGHRKIFFLKTVDAYSSSERVRAFKDILSTNNVYFDDSYFSQSVSNREEASKEISKFLIKRNGFTAIITGNDFIAIGAMDAIFKSNLNIPEDISIIGYDNSMFSECLRTPLTTVKQQEILFGKLAAERLIEMIEDPKIKKKPKKIVIKPQLVIRNSVKKIN